MRIPAVPGDLAHLRNMDEVIFLYCYPDKVTDELIAEIRDNDRILKYIDLPMQHISDPMLRAMNRHGDYFIMVNLMNFKL